MTPLMNPSNHFALAANGPRQTTSQTVSLPFTGLGATNSDALVSDSPSEETARTSLSMSMTKGLPDGREKLLVFLSWISSSSDIQRQSETRVRCESGRITARLIPTVHGSQTEQHTIGPT